MRVNHKLLAAFYRNSANTQWTIPKLYHIHRDNALVVALTLLT